MLETFKFLMSVAGASALTKMFVKDIQILNIKPLSCPLCMGFWYGFIFQSLPVGFVSFESFMSGFMGAAFSWFFYNYITNQF